MKKYRDLKPKEKLKATDEMRRADWTYASTYEWFRLPKFDIGKEAKYFVGSGFLLRRPIKSRKKSDKMETKFKVVIGDWSKDGHNQSEQYLFECNASIPDVKNAYKKAVKICKVSLHRDAGDPDPILARYQDSKIPGPKVFALKILGVNFDFLSREDDIDEEEDGSLYFNTEDVAYLFMEMVRTQIDGFTYKRVNDEIPVINGFWSDDFNYSFGYGTFAQ